MGVARPRLRSVRARLAAEARLFERATAPLRAGATRLGAGGPHAPRSNGAICGARVLVAGARLVVVRARHAAEGRLGLRAAARLRAGAARESARGPGAEGLGHAVRGARGGVAGARLGGVRARHAAERRLGGAAAALLRASAARLGARGPGAEVAHDAVGGARGGVAVARLGQVRAHVAAVRGHGRDGARALLRAGAARRGAGGPAAERALDAVDGARGDVAGE